MRLHYQIEDEHGEPLCEVGEESCMYFTKTFANREAATQWLLRKYGAWPDGYTIVPTDQ
jgi:hypothetical protein